MSSPGKTLPYRKGHLVVCLKQSKLLLGNNYLTLTIYIMKKITYLFSGFIILILQFNYNKSFAQCGISSTAPTIDQTIESVWADAPINNITSTLR